MTIGLFILAVFIQLAVVLAIFLLSLSRVSGSVLAIITVLVTAFIHPWSLVLGVPIALLSLILLIPAIRQTLITKPVYKALGNAMPSMSDTEREALDAGTSWWEKELFMGAPNWRTFENYTYPQLSEEEQHFIDHEVEMLCSMLDEWQINAEYRDLPPHVWQFIKDNGFLGLIIPKQYGGLEFSAYAQSRVMSKIASRSPTAAVSCMVPNSLGPGELLMHYGTEAQKQYWLPGLANGEQIPCFGLTGPEAGSDAGAIPDTGVVCYGIHDGQHMLGLNMNFSKRWITLAPIATVVGLAFKMHDPEGLLGDPDKTDYGITCALIPADHEGVVVGPRHYPSGSPFMNGTVDGTDVFIPLDYIIGGVENAGRGWRMLMECLAVGRGISLPALSTSASEMSYLSVGAFSKVREQFKISVGKFEGVQDATSRIASHTYMLESFRHLVTCGLNEGGSPSVMTAMAKYYATETMREVVNDGMDIVGGRAIQMGPRNFLAIPYQAIPVSITVEGANILTRSLMIFGQGAMRCHPYLFDELQLLQNDDKKTALTQFDTLFFKHLGYTFNRGAKAFVAGYIGGSRQAPSYADGFTRPYYKHINRLSASFALTADMALGLLAGDLKRKEMLSGRLADIHSHLFIATAILQFYQHGSKSDAERLHAKVALQHSLYTIQEAFADFFANFPNRIAANIVGFVTFPSGRIFTPVSDDLKRKLGDTFMDDFEANPFRDYLKTMVYYNTDPEDATGRMENAYQALLAIEPLWKSFKKAEHNGDFAGLTFEDHVVYASQNGDITEDEAEQLIHYNSLRFDSLLTDVFDEHLLQAQERINPHSLENAVHQLTDYAQTKSDAQQRRNQQLAAEQQAQEETLTANEDTPAAATDTNDHTGDANPNHGYETDGDVTLVGEQDSAKEAQAQTDFDESNPQAQALKHRARDAESMLSERMSHNHSRHTQNDAYQEADQQRSESQTLDEQSIYKQAQADSSDTKAAAKKEQDGHSDLYHEDDNKA
ncbi:acyl-CoA dehydrogenase [Psychrobacter sp. F1192]|uniref:Acyl-coenzyme A dehydrogenase n=1 Tax=Psychrobacter coccoides TaxID=2818440 RepID=A0ABS3NQC6_9GAMM|nr:acyl-CoA dehydrogenase [Psychrobacter coccoides]MBO1531558.1 acyl-CoA dehydrogenase [Psychrobacter coccoides]